MLGRYNLTLAIALGSAIGLFFLGSEDASMPDAQQTNAVLPAQAPAQQESEAPTKTKEPSEQEVASEPNAEIPEEPATVAFEPPFPDRVNPFLAPKRQGRASVKARGQNESAIELLGFVNVDGPRVALSIDGLVETAGEGDKLQGIEIISIKPPAVLLQRGRQRWQAALEN